MRSRSRCSKRPAIRINSHSWLRSSSTHEPSDSPLRVIIHEINFIDKILVSVVFISNRDVSCIPALAQFQQISTEEISVNAGRVLAPSNGWTDYKFTRHLVRPSTVKN